VTISEQRWEGALRVAPKSFDELRAPGDAGRFVAVFFVDSEPGFGMMVVQRAKDLGVSREEAARRLRETLALAAGGDLCMTSVVTADGLDEMLADLDVRDAALLSQVAALTRGAEPASGHARVVLLAEGQAEERIVALANAPTEPFAGEAASEDERDERLNVVLNEEGAGPEMLTKLRKFVATGVALRNAAAYVEREADGKRHVIVGYRTGVAEAVKARVPRDARIGAVLSMLKGKPLAGNFFCVFVLWRGDGRTDIACVQLRLETGASDSPLH
jgi:hypothetical protein